MGIPSNYASCLSFSKHSSESQVTSAIPTAHSYKIHVISPECIVSPLIFNCFDGSSKNNTFFNKEIFPYYVPFPAGFLYWYFSQQVSSEECRSVFSLGFHFFSDIFFFQRYQTSPHFSLGGVGGSPRARFFLTSSILPSDERFILLLLRKYPSLQVAAAQQSARTHKG